MTEHRPITAEEFAPLSVIAAKYGAARKEDLFRFVDTRLKKEYNVWLLQNERCKLILKKDKKRRGDKTVYDTYFAGSDFAVAKILDAVEIGEDLYVVMEYADGEDARGCCAEDAARIGKELARIQRAHLREGGRMEQTDRYFTRYVEADCSKIRGWFDGFDEVYEIVRNRFFEAQHTLVHDDLLPINVLLNAENIWFIDWETSGILPYFVDLARFAFVTDREEKFFIPPEAAERFLAAYYETMCACPAYTATRDEFLRDVAISAFCQYASFLSGEEEATVRETGDYQYMAQIVAYLRG